MPTPTPSPLDILADLSVALLTRTLQDPAAEPAVKLRAAAMALRHVNAERNRAERIAARLAHAEERRARTPRPRHAAPDDADDRSDPEDVDSDADATADQQLTQVAPSASRDPDGNCRCKRLRAAGLAEQTVLTPESLQDIRPP